VYIVTTDGISESKNIFLLEDLIGLPGHMFWTWPSADLPSAITRSCKPGIHNVQPKLSNKTVRLTILTSSLRIEMGQGISDMFYPDNPNRRNRAEQLREDILAYLNSYDEIKKARYLFRPYRPPIFLTPPTGMNY
jgi:hypothetical protein